jgi:Na+-transporting methylmalonyl-CoA/oxaloacetate decarboxylase gamma subunit
MARGNTRVAHPAVSQQIEQMLKARNIDFDFEPNVQIAEIRHADGNQVRLTEHQAPKEQVAKYATAMKHGASFPAIVVNDRLEKIDGNTRLEARIKNGDDTIAAYICHAMTPLEARSLSVELNQSNGLAMTDEEIRRFIDGAVLEGQQPEVRTLSRMTGVRETKISRWIAETQFLTRARAEDIEERHINALPPSTRAALQVARLAAVFRALTILAAEARMPAALVKKIVAETNGADSEADALAIVENERASRADEIRAVASGFSPRDNRRSKGSAQHIGGLARFEVDDLLDVSPDKQFETFQRVKLIRDRLDQVVTRAEREWDLTPPAESADEAQAAPASTDEDTVGAEPVAVN